MIIRTSFNFLLVLFLLLTSCSKKPESGKIAISGTEEQVDTNELEKNTMAYFKEIQNEQKLVLSSEDQMLSITDSLFSKDDLNQGFYFVVFTKSMNGADGVLSEAIGISAYEYAQSNTKQFAQNFSSIHELNDNDFDNWAKYLFNEIQIRAEGNEIEEIIKFEKQLMLLINDNNEHNIRVIQLLIEKVENYASKRHNP